MEEKKINEAVDKAIANLNVDDLKVTKEQIDQIKKRLAENKTFVEKLTHEENKTK